MGIAVCCTKQSLPQFLRFGTLDEEWQTMFRRLFPQNFVSFALDSLDIRNGCAVSYLLVGFQNGARNGRTAFFDGLIEVFALVFVQQRGITGFHQRQELN